MPRTILVVDDEPAVRSMLRDYLSEQGWRAVTAADGREALRALHVERPDLVLLDLLMPEVNGLEFLATVRRESSVPIIIVTAQIEEGERILGLELGADDYICKPFNLREVRARIQAVLRRGQPETGRETLRLGGVELDAAAHTVRANGQLVDLTPSEFELLATLIASPGRVYSRQDLLVRLANDLGSERTVDVHIKNLRAKLEPDPSAPRWIETVFGVGYRFRAEEP